MKRLFALSASFIIAIATFQGIAVQSAFASAPNPATNISISNASPASTAMDRAAISVSFTPSIVDGSHSAPIAYIISATATGKVSGSTTIACSPCSNTKIDAIVENLAGGVTYDVVVTAKKDAFETPATAIPFLTQSIPNKPTIVSAVPGVKKVTLTWAAPTNTGGLALSRYNITATGISTIASDTETTKTIEGLTDGTTYSFKIVAVNANGESASSDFSEAETADVPEAPTGVTATVNATTISNSWSAPSNSNGSAITEYKVYLINSAGVDVTAQTKTTTNTTVEMTTVSAGTYTVKVTAKNAVGESARSSASSSVTIAGAALLDNNPTITPSTIGDVFVDETLVIGASSNFGTVTFGVNGNPAGACTYSAGVVTAVAAGTCTITATTPGDATYATGSATKTFTIQKVSQVITFPVVSSKLVTDAFTAAASSSASLTVAFTATGVCSVSGSSVTFSAAGTCTLTASQAGNSKYAAAANVVRSFSVTSSLSGGFFGGGGGGGALAAAAEEEKADTPALFKVVDSENTSKPLPGEVCIELYDLKKTVSGLVAGKCSKTDGLIDLKVADGKYRILVFAVGITDSSLEYTGEAAKGVFTVDGTAKASDSTRFLVKLKAAPPIPKITPTPSATKPSPTISTLPSNSATPKSVKDKSTSTLAKNPFLKAVSTSKPSRTVVFSSKTQLVTLKIGASFMATAKNLPAKTPIVAKALLPNGLTITLFKKTFTKSSAIKLPVLKFTKPGIYSIQLTAGKSSKIIRLKVSK
jgi:hypothetical protein